MNPTTEYTNSKIKAFHERMQKLSIFSTPKSKMIWINIFAVVALLGLPEGIISTPIIAFFATLPIAKYFIDMNLDVPLKTIILLHLLQAFVFIAISRLTFYGIIVAWILSAYVIYETKGNLDNY